MANSFLFWPVSIGINCNRELQLSFPKHSLKLSLSVCVWFSFNFVNNLTNLLWIYKVEAEIKASWSVILHSFPTETAFPMYHIFPGTEVVTGVNLGSHQVCEHNYISDITALGFTYISFQMSLCNISHPQ